MLVGKSVAETVALHEQQALQDIVWKHLVVEHSLKVSISVSNNCYECSRVQLTVP
jgi:hypothetical protein